MRVDDPGDPLLDALHEMPRLLPRARCDTRVVARCHAALERRRQSARRPPAVSLPPRIARLGLAAAACSYAIATALELLRLARKL
jgi:hypothetical protein